MKTQHEIRRAFWLTFFVEGCPREYRGKSQNQLPADLRAAFVNFVDDLARDGTITESLAARVTL